MFFTSALNANHDAPVVEASVPYAYAHGSKARMQVTCFHFISPVSNWGSASSCSKLFGIGLGAGNPGGSGMKKAFFACPCLHVVGSQILFAADLQALGAFDGTRPAPSHLLMRDSLMHSSSGARF